MSQGQHGRHGTTVTGTDRGPRGTMVRPGARGGNGTFVVLTQNGEAQDSIDWMDEAKTTVMPTRKSAIFADPRGPDEERGLRGRRIDTLLAFAAGSIATALILLVVLLAVRR